MDSYKRRGPGLRPRPVILFTLITVALVLGVAVVILAAGGEGPVYCAIRRATGLLCPSCGMTRALGALWRIDLAAAARYNLFAFPLIAVSLWSYIVLGANALFGAGWRYPFPGRRPLLTLAVVAVLLILFTVLRNVPGKAFELLRPMP